MKIQLKPTALTCPKICQNESDFSRLYFLCYFHYPTPLPTLDFILRISTMNLKFSMSSTLLTTSPYPFHQYTLTLTH